MNHKTPIPGFTQRLLRVIGDEPPYAWAQRLKIPKATLHGLLRQASPSTATLLKIAQQTPISLNWLLTGHGPERLPSIPPVIPAGNHPADKEIHLAPQPLDATTTPWPDHHGSQTDFRLNLPSARVWIRVDGA